MGLALILATLSNSAYSVAQNANYSTPDFVPPVAITPTGVTEDPAVFTTPEGPMLHEACHRVCGLYEARLERFELRLRVDAFFGGWSIYDHPPLRRR